MRGSCVCGCPNTKATQATCFDIDATALDSTEQAAEACASMHSRAGLGCPHTGIVQQCGLRLQRADAIKNLGIDYACDLDNSSLDVEYVLEAYRRYGGSIRNVLSFDRRRKLRNVEATALSNFPLFHAGSD